MGSVRNLLKRSYTESGLKLLGLDLTSLATQGVCAGAQPNACTGNGIVIRENKPFYLSYQQNSEHYPYAWHRTQTHRGQGGILYRQPLKHLFCMGFIVTQPEKSSAASAHLYGEAIRRQELISDFAESMP